jgi:hypothetical protein
MTDTPAKKKASVYDNVTKQIGRASCRERVLRIV